MAQSAVNRAVRISTDIFRQGYAQGVRGVYRGNCLLPKELTEQEIVGIIKNLCELSAEGNLNESQLIYDAGILTGYTVSMVSSK